MISETFQRTRNCGPAAVYYTVVVTAREMRIWTQSVMFYTERTSQDPISGDFSKDKIYLCEFLPRCQNSSSLCVGMNVSKCLNNMDGIRLILETE
jgi:hypothetical protein